MLLALSALAAPTGVLLADRELGELSRGLDHRVVELTAEEATALRAYWEHARQTSWTPDCPGSHQLILREPDRQSWLSVLGEDGQELQFGGHPWRWDGRWPVGPSCTSDPDKLGPLLAQPLQRLLQARTYAYRVVLPVHAEPARGDLVVFVLDAGQPQAELEVTGSMEEKPGASLQLDTLLEDRLYALATELAPFGLVRVDAPGGSSGARGELVRARRHATLTWSRGAELEGLHDAVVSRGAVLDRLWQPATWSWLVLLPEADPAAAETLLRARFPQALEVRPW
jgi:hypothetical protein